MAETPEDKLSIKVKPLWLKALSALELNNYGYAITLIQAVLKEDPGFLVGRRMLRKAEIHKNSGNKGFLKGLGGSSIQVMKAKGLLKKDPLATIEAVEKILETDPANLDANFLLRDAAMAAEMPETARFALETLKEAHPTDTKILHTLARFYMDNGDPEKAVTVYGKLSELNPLDQEAKKLGKDAAARSSMKSGGWETAGSYRDLIVNKDQAIAAEQKNRAHKDEATIDELLVELWALYEENPKNLDVARRTADLYDQKGELDKALEWYQYANGLSEGGDPGILRKITDLQLRQLVQRMEVISEWLATGPEENEETAAFRAELEQLTLQRADLELTEARRRVDRNPTELGLRLELGELLVNVGKYNEAIPELQKARSSPNGRYKAIMLLGKCYMARKMYDIAIGQLQEAEAELPTMDALKKEVVYTIGLLHEKMGNPEKSIEYMKKIYSVDASYMDVSERVESSYNA